MASSRGGANRNQGNIKDDVVTITLDEDMRTMLNAIVRHKRSFRGAKLAHKQVVKELIEAEWSQLDAGWLQDAQDDSGDTHALPQEQSNG